MVSSINCVCKIFRKTNISNSQIRRFVYQGVRNVNFSENVACALNGWPQFVVQYFEGCPREPFFHLSNWDNEKVVNRSLDVISKIVNQTWSVQKIVPKFVSCLDLVIIFFLQNCENINSVPQISRFLLADAKISSK